MTAAWIAIITMEIGPAAAVIAAPKASTFTPAACNAGDSVCVMVVRVPDTCWKVRVCSRARPNDSDMPSPIDWNTLVSPPPSSVSTSAFARRTICRHACRKPSSYAGEIWTVEVLPKSSKEFAADACSANKPFLIASAAMRPILSPSASTPPLDFLSHSTSEAPVGADFPKREDLNASFAQVESMSAFAVKSFMPFGRSSEASLIAAFLSLIAAAS